jgi:hypothetical protein
MADSIPFLGHCQGPLPGPSAGKKADAVCVCDAGRHGICTVLDLRNSLSLVTNPIGGGWPPS